MDLFRKKKMVVISVVILISFISCLMFFFSSKPQEAEQEKMFVELEQQEEQEVAPEIDEPVVIKVDVKGAVQSPGVFIAEPGDRVIDVIEAAGNFKKDADLDKVNLAQLVEDQMVIYVPSIGEEDIDLPGSIDVIGGGVKTVSGNGGTDGDKVNLNTATKEELETLSGIGPAKSTAIIEYREKTGKFEQIEDLKNISGIGDKTFEKLQDSITVK
ncbi:helix-hairpin-helix domain-containing protein [Peribacillus asahii]|uniref:helix-hairpin-helix domain-containing protein n=1 Tax=Peribacillus asahii TaxID=228899 RepID=UPI00207A4600|nr:helix-hairpin-helix domain-containing protein [Peribacillus asahii]USK69277.1 helix-hairpin-helix domain-containing protein [Peribacillus asahii]